MIAWKIMTNTGIPKSHMTETRKPKIGCWMIKCYQQFNFHFHLNRLLMGTKSLIIPTTITSFTIANLICANRHLFGSNLWWLKLFLAQIRMIIFRYELNLRVRLQYYTVCIDLFEFVYVKSHIQLKLDSISFFNSGYELQILKV